MNFSLKSKTFNGLGTPNVSPGVSIDSAIETGARIVGVVMSVTGGGLARFALFTTVGGVDTAVANGHVATVGTNRSWWAGLPTQYKDVAVVQAGPVADTVNGVWPLCSQTRWIDSISNAVYELKLLVETTVGGSVIVFYTVDPPTNAGENC